MQILSIFCRIMKVGGIYEITPISNFYEAVIVEELHAGCQATGFMFSIFNNAKKLVRCRFVHYLPILIDFPPISYVKIDVRNDFFEETKAKIVQGNV